MAIVEDGIRFFNTAGLESRDESAGRLMPRISKAVRNQLSPRGQFVGMCSIGVEMQFVSDAHDFRVTLSTADPELEFTVYQGEFEHASYRVPHGKVVTTHVECNEHFDAIDRAHLAGAYDPSVWRIVVTRGSAYFHGIDTFGSTRRAPIQAELPKLTWLAYGSSITNSTGKGYPHHAARELGVQVMNKGMSGCCLVEPQIVDELSDLGWDFATCELGVNMRGHQPFADVFEERVTYLLDRFRAAQPGKPLGLITIFPNSNHHFTGERENVGSRHQAYYCDVLRRLAAERAADGVFLIEGADVLDRFAGLYTDLLHPSDYGHVRMGMNLSNLLKGRV